MSDMDSKDKIFWRQIEKWEKEWEKQRKAQRLEDSRKLHDAEQDYERSLKNLNPLAPPIKPHEILGTGIREQGTKALLLKDPGDYPLIMPARITSIEQPHEKEACISFQVEEGISESTLEAIAFQIKKLMEYILDERFLFLLQPEGESSLLMRIIWDTNASPVFKITLFPPQLIKIKVIADSIPWSHGYIFDCIQILKHVVERLKKAA